MYSFSLVEVGILKRRLRVFPTKFWGWYSFICWNGKFDSHFVGSQLGEIYQLAYNICGNPSMFFSCCFKGAQVSWLPVISWEDEANRGSTLKRQNLLGSKFFPLRVDSHWEIRFKKSSCLPCLFTQYIYEYRRHFCCGVLVVQRCTL